MSVDFTRLAGQGRSYNGARAWSPEELEALLLLETARGVSRTIAADFIRNGITTLEAYDAAAAAGFKPKTLNEASTEAELSLKENEFSTAPEEEPVADPVPVVEPVVEESVPAPVEETVADPEEEVAPKKGKK